MWCCKRGFVGCMVSVSFGEMVVDVFDYDYGGINDDVEVDGVY